MKENKISVSEALERLEAGQPISEFSIDFDHIKVEALNVMKLSKAGIEVPEEAVYYDDADIQYDPDFDDVEWGEPIRFDEIKEKLFSENAQPTEWVLKLPVQNLDMNRWLMKNKEKLHLIISGLVESMYKAERGKG